MSNQSEMVKQFTEGSSGTPCPDKPIEMSRDSVFYLIRMVMSELDELANTVCQNEMESIALMREALDKIDVCHSFPTNPVSRIAAQADAMVDANYYMLNVAAKHGMNLSRLFDIVHDANMAKRDPITNQFIRRQSDGKVMKPAGWKEPDIDGEIARQIREGSWK